MMRKIGVLIAIMLFLFSGVGIAMAQPPNVVTLSDPIEINTEPPSIPADGVSTSNITITVFYPKEEVLGFGNLGGTPAANTRVDVRTTLGKLISCNDAEDINNTGKEITVFTGDYGVVTVLLSGDETGVANITARAPLLEGVVNETIYVVKNSTTVTLLEDEATPTAPSGGDDSGNGGIPPTPPAETPAYIALGVNPADIPADGSATSTLTASVWNGEYWVLENLTVNFSTDLGDITASALIENGTATAILTAGTEDLGVATITAEANLNGDIGIITNTTTVNFTAQDVTPAPPVLTPTPTVTVSPTPTVTATPSPSPTKKPLIPGFEAVFAIASLLSVAYLVMRRGRKA